MGTESHFGGFIVSLDLVMLEDALLSRRVPCEGRTKGLCIEEVKRVRGGELFLHVFKVDMVAVCAHVKIHMLRSIIPACPP